ncbi:MAG: N-acetylmuramoyl-L-alanine amidase [Candidatus Omnitrophica bacterium]|nr:N-acetylmuramoyl-L-alanine amidase [Candidatus Omnitrophota bacterium]
MNIRQLIFYSLALIFLLFLNSCATISVTKSPSLPSSISPTPIGPIVRTDTFHIVAPGETLWRISKMYDVPMDDIIKANNLGGQILEKGQRLLIPNAAPPVPVIPLYPSNRWKYIIIHHSATDEGSSLDFDKYHQAKGWEEIGYHFVIDNGSKGKQDGLIEVSPRWVKQKIGSHCKASNMNEKAIGICLVGNFNKEYVSKKQLDSLIYLVNLLRKYYHIPIYRILGHGQVKGARTDCPGKNFPWLKFKNLLIKKYNLQDHLILKTVN